MPPEEPKKSTRRRPKFGETIGYLDEQGQKPTDHPWSDGQMVGKYQVQRLIARGGMSFVYLAIDTFTGQQVAIKVLPPSPLWTQRSFDRFEREIKILAKLKLPNVVKFFDNGVYEGARYYVMDYIPGNTLSELIDQRRFSVTEAARLVRNVAKILDALHKHGVVHRDIKPSNIIIGPKSQPVLTDFGIAKALEDDSFTVTSEILGTPFYMSPEQIQGRKELIDHRSDIYSLGVILYELATGKRPFEAENLPTVMYNVVHKEAAPPSGVAPNLPRSLDVITLKALEKDPNRRYQTAGQMADELTRFLRGAEITFTIAERSRKIAQFVRRHAVVFTLLFSLSVLGLGLYLISRARASEPQAPMPTPPVRPAINIQKMLPESDPVKEATAKRKLEGADEFYRQGKWEEARQMYVELNKDFEETLIVRDRAEYIGGRIADCDSHLSEHRRAVERRIADATGKMKARRWSEARQLWEDLVADAPAGFEASIEFWRTQSRKCALEMEADRPLVGLDLNELEDYRTKFKDTETYRARAEEIEQLIAGQRAEREAETLINEIHAKQKTRQWAQIVPLIERLRTEHKNTRAWDTVRDDMIVLHAQAIKESGAEELMVEAEQLRNESRWRDLNGTIAKLESNFADTTTYKSNRDKLKTYRDEAQKQMAATREQDAEAVFKRANDMFLSRKYKQAKTEYAKLLQDDLKETELVRGKLKDIQDKMADCDVRVKEDEAEALFQTARKKREVKAWSEALEAVRSLRDGFADTQVVQKRRAREIEEILREAIPIVTRLDFEAEGQMNTGWRVDHGGYYVNPPGSTEFVAGLEGKKALQLTASSVTMTWFFYELRDIPREVTHLSFAIKSSRSVKISVLLGLDVRPSSRSDFFEYTYQQPSSNGMTVPIDLKQFMRKSDRFNPANLAPKNGPKPIVVIGFRLPTDAQIVIDNLQFEYRSK